MNSLTVIEVNSPKDLDDFIKFPFFLYAKDPFFIPPLIKDMYEKLSDKNPFFGFANCRYFLAKKEGKISGRIVSIINKRHIEFHGEKAGFFGFFEFTNDTAIVSALLDTVSEILKSEGMEVMRGPMNFSTNEECGFLFEGFNEPPVFMTPYNPFYYNDLMEGHGMKKAKDLYAYTCDIPKNLPGKILRVASIAEQKGIRVRLINKNFLNSEMKIFMDIYNSAWERNWGFIPLTEEETIYLADKIKPIVVPELTLVAETSEEPVGFMGVIPDYNLVLKMMKGKLNPLTIFKAIYYSKKIRNLRMLLLGIKPNYRNKGVGALLFREGFRASKKYERIEFSWILEDNIPVQRLVEMIGGKLYKKYRIYEKRL
ncbi:MAG: GNAT family N-acetyltransferase [Nitrospirota bacterium]